MFLEEAIWIKNVLERLNLLKGQVVLNLGSSDEEYRRLIQPHIDYYIFRPLRKCGVKIVHVDQKKLDGVDVVLDLEDPDADILLDKIERGDVVICSNLLEHVNNRGLVIDRVKKLTKKGGVIIVTVPNVYRYHPDPIDTMYRPTNIDLENLFPIEEFTKIESGIIEVEAEPVVIWPLRKKILYLAKQVLRKFHLTLEPETPIIIKNKVSVLAIRKNGGI